MKKDIHPQYYPKAKVTCACGNSFSTGSTVEEIQIEICSMCHPFYTGKQKLMDDRGRVERFKKMVEKKQVIKKSGASHTFGDIKLGHGYDASRLFLKDNKKETKQLEIAIRKALEVVSE